MATTENIYKCKNCGKVLLDYDRTQYERDWSVEREFLNYHLCKKTGNFREWGVLERIGIYENTEI